MANEENSTIKQASEVQAADAQQVRSQSTEPERKKAQTENQGRRLRELLAIPDRDRTDAQWDEITELEIQLAPVNRSQTSTIKTDAGRNQQPNRQQPSRRAKPAGRPERSRRQ
jgi:hypothetical protein